MLCVWRVFFILIGCGVGGSPLFPNNTLGASLKYHPDNRSYLNLSVEYLEQYNFQLYF